MSRKVTQAVEKKGQHFNLNLPVPLYLSPKQLIQCYQGKMFFLQGEEGNMDPSVSLQWEEWEPKVMSPQNRPSGSTWIPKWALGLQGHSSPTGAGITRPREAAPVVLILVVQSGQPRAFAPPDTWDLVLPGPDTQVPGAEEAAPSQLCKKGAYSAENCTQIPVSLAPAAAGFAALRQCHG